MTVGSHVDAPLRRLHEMAPVSMNPPRSPGRQLFYAARLLALLVTYIVLGRLGLAMNPVSGFATPIWAPTALSLVVLTIGGYRFWPGVALGAFATNLWMGAPPLAACGMAVGNTLEAVAGTFALRSIPGFRGSLDRLIDIISLVVLAGMVSTAISATVGTVSLALAGVVSRGNFAQTWGVWWTGDLMADLILAPLLLTWAWGRRVALRPAELAEAATLGTLLVTFAAVIFSQRADAAVQSRIFLPSALFGPLIWAALRFDTRGAATGTFVVAVAAVWGTSTGHGAFVRANPTDSLIALDFFLASASLASLVLGAIVCELKQSHSKLRESESVLRTLINGAIDAVFVKDRLGRYVVINSAGASALGMPAEAVIGKDDEALFPAAEAQRLQEMDNEVFRTGRPQTNEESVTIAGTARIYHVIKAPYRDHAGNVVGVIGICRDITERKAEELARAWLAAIVESSPDAVVGTSLDGTITSWNAAAERMFGSSREEAIGQPVSMLAPPGQRDELAGLFDRLRRGERIARHEATWCRQGGARIDVAAALSPIRDDTSAVIGLAAIVRDITEQKRVERALRQSEERQRLAVEAAELGMWCWDMKSEHLVWTSLCRSMHGIGLNEPASYARFLLALHPDDRERTERAVKCALEACAEYRIEYRVVFPKGIPRWIFVLGRCFHDDAGKPDRMLGVALDITAQKRVEQERGELLAREQAALVEAQAAARAKDDFLAVLSHELRSPLQSMLGWTQMLKTRVHDADAVRKGLVTIERNVRRQAQLIEDLLDVSRIVAGKFRLELKRVDLAEVVGAALQEVKSATDAKEIQLDATIAPVAGFVLGDAERLQQVVANLLTNAVKFTPIQGKIGVRLEREGTTARIMVEDTGRGISPAFLPHVFDRFRQAETGTTRRQGGLGLGLAIVRHIVEMHGGTVKAESPGDGRGAPR